MRNRGSSQYDFLMILDFSVSFSLPRFKDILTPLVNYSINYRDTNVVWEIEIDRFVFSYPGNVIGLFRLIL